MYVADPERFAFGSAAVVDCPDDLPCCFGYDEWPAQLYVTPDSYMAIGASPGAGGTSLAGVLHCLDGVYFVDEYDLASADICEYAYAVRGKNPAAVFHEATHASVEYMRKIVRGGLIANCPFNLKDITDFEGTTCHGCEMGKATRLPYSGSHEFDVTTDNEVYVYMDVHGPSKTATLSGAYKYYVLFLGRRSKWTWLYLLHHERELPHVTDVFLKEYFSTFQSLPTVIHMDGAGVNRGKKDGRGSRQAVLDHIANSDTEVPVRTGTSVSELAIWSNKTKQAPGSNPAQLNSSKCPQNREKW